MPKISIIMPIYNVSKYLRECLDSVVNQTLKDIEIICVNDGSTDNSLDIINEYAKYDNRIIVIDKKNAGMGAAYNSGLEIANGEYIGFVEPDDYISLNMYEDLYNCSSDEIDYIKSDHYFIKNGIEYKANCYKQYKNGIYDNTKIRELLFRHISHWSGIYKREFIEKYNIRFAETPGASFQDAGFIFQVYFLASKIYLTNNAYYYYRIHENQSSFENEETYLKQLYWNYNQYLYSLNALNKYFKVIPEEKVNYFIYLLYKRPLKNYQRCSKGKNIQFIKDLSVMLNRKDVQPYYNKSIFNFEDRIVYNLIKKCPLIAFLYIKFPIINYIQKILLTIQFTWV